MRWSVRNSLDCPSQPDTPTQTIPPTLFPTERCVVPRASILPTSSWYSVHLQMSSNLTDSRPQLTSLEVVRSSLCGRLRQLMCPRLHTCTLHDDHWQLGRHWTSSSGTLHLFPRDSSGKRRILLHHHITSWVHCTSMTRGGKTPNFAYRGHLGGSQDRICTLLFNWVELIKIPKTLTGS